MSLTPSIRRLISAAVVVSALMPVARVAANQCICPKPIASQPIKGNCVPASGLFGTASCNPDKQKPGYCQTPGANCKTCHTYQQGMTKNKYVARGNCVAQAGDAVPGCVNDGTYLFWATKAKSGTENCTDN
jgi:hypothetical protein